MHVISCFNNNNNILIKFADPICCFKCARIGHIARSCKPAGTRKLVNNYDMVKILHAKTLHAKTCGIVNLCQ